MADCTLTIIGSLGKEPELKFTNSGKSLAEFTMAVSHRYRKGDDWAEETAWWDVIAWGALGENVAASCPKGTRVIVTGRVKQEEWDDRETGKKRTKMVCVADAVGVELRWATATVERIERDRV